MSRGPRRTRRAEPAGRLPAAMLRALAAELSDPGRFSRAKAYARDGAVIDIEVEPGQVRGQVQGSRFEPYAVTDPHRAGRRRRGAARADPRARRAAVPSAAARTPTTFGTCKHGLAVLLVLADEVSIETDVLERWRSADGDHPQPRRPPTAATAEPAAPVDVLLAALTAPLPLPTLPEIPSRVPVAMAATPGTRDADVAAALAAPSPSCAPAEGRRSGGDGERRRACAALGGALAQQRDQLVAPLLDVAHRVEAADEELRDAEVVVLQQRVGDLLGRADVARRVTTAAGDSGDAEEEAVVVDVLLGGPGPEAGGADGGVLDAVALDPRAPGPPASTRRLGGVEDRRRPLPRGVLGRGDDRARRQRELDLAAVPGRRLADAARCARGVGERLAPEREDVGVLTADLDRRVGLAAEVDRDAARLRGGAPS